MNRSFSKRYQIKILQWAKIRSSVYTNKNIQFTRLLVKLQSQDKWYIGIDVHVLFISLEEELKSTNQIRSILLGARDRRKKDEASQYRSVIESPFFFLSLSLSFFFLSKRGLLSANSLSPWKLVVLPGTPFVYRPSHSSCHVLHRENRVFRLSNPSVRSFAIIGRSRVDFLWRRYSFISRNVPLRNAVWLYNTNSCLDWRNRGRFLVEWLECNFYSRLRLFSVYLKLIIGEKSK